eukprot:3936147-Rhodomonas_salina.3
MCSAYLSRCRRTVSARTTPSIPTRSLTPSNSSLNSGTTRRCFSTGHPPSKRVADSGADLHAAHNALDPPGCTASPISVPANAWAGSLCSYWKAKELSERQYRTWHSKRVGQYTSKA